MGKWVLNVEKWVIDAKKPKNSWDAKKNTNLKMQIKAKKLDNNNIIISGNVKVYSMLYNNHLH